MDIPLQRSPVAPGPERDVPAGRVAQRPVSGRAAGAGDEDPAPAGTTTREGDDDFYFVERDTEQLLALRGRVWGSDHPHTDRQFLSWMFSRTPPGTPAGIMVRHKGRAVGFAGLCPKRLFMGGREVGLAHGLDYMIEPGLGDILAGRVALRVAQRWNRMAAQRGFSSGVVFPNSKSTRILTSDRVGMVPISRPDLLVRPLPTARFAEPLHHVPPAVMSMVTRVGALVSAARAQSYARPAGAAAVVERFDAGFDALWHAARDDLGIATVRDAAYLNWRFADHPIYRYHVIGWRHDGAWLGYAVCVERRLFGVDTLLLVDVLAPQLDSVGPALIDAAVQEACRRGLGMVVTLATRGSRLHQALRGRGFLGVPARVNPKRFLVAERVYDESAKPVYAAEPRYFTWSDMDVV